MLYLLDGFLLAHGVVKVRQITPVHISDFVASRHRHSPRSYNGLIGVYARRVEDEAMLEENIAACDRITARFKCLAASRRALALRRASSRSGDMAMEGDPVRFEMVHRAASSRNGSFVLILRVTLLRRFLLFRGLRRRGATL